MAHAGDAAGRVAGKVALITGAARGQGRVNLCGVINLSS